VSIGLGLTLVSYLTDTGLGLLDPGVFPPSYPVAATRRLRNLATNLFFTVATGQLIVIELLRNGTPVPGFVITYGPGETGVKAVTAGPTVFNGAPVPDTFDLRVTTTNVSNDGAVNVSATVGVE
jgi:hypothetical protein